MSDDAHAPKSDPAVPPTVREISPGTTAATPRDAPPQGVPPTARDDRRVGIPATARDTLARSVPATTAETIVRRDTPTPSEPLPGRSNQGSFSLPHEFSQRYRRIPFKPKPSGEADLYLLESLTTGEQVMLKWYRPQVNPKSEVLEQVSQSDPDHVVRLLEYGQIVDGYGDGRYYEILEYAAGGSLQDLVDQEGPRLNDNTAREVLTELLAAVAHLHDQHIVHRDLKPGNILVRRRHPLDLVLTDFGISSVVDSSIHMTSFKGTCAYVSPEAMIGQVSSESDYWSIGMILIEILTGSHPFRLSDGQWLDDQRIRVHIAIRGIDASKVEGRWQRLCRGLLHRDPKLRWGKDEIARWLAGDDAIPLADDIQREPQRPPLPLDDELVMSPQELAAKLTLHWEQGKLKLERGDIGDWLRRYWSGSAAVMIARVDELEHERNLDADSKLFRLITYLDPQSEPTFRGYGTAIHELGPLAEEAVRGNADAAAIVSSLFDLRILSTYARLAGKPEYSKLDEGWRASTQEFEALRSRIEAQSAVRVTALPAREQVIVRTLAAALSPDFSGNARHLILCNSDASACSWFAEFGDVENASTAMLLVMQSLAPVAASEVQLERENEAERIRQAAAAKRALVRRGQRFGMYVGGALAVLFILKLSVPANFAVIVLLFAAVGAFIGWGINEHWVGGAIGLFLGSLAGGLLDDLFTPFAKWGALGAVAVVPTLIGGCAAIGGWIAALREQHLPAVPGGAAAPIATRRTGLIVAGLLALIVSVLALFSTEKAVESGPAGRIEDANARATRPSGQEAEAQRRARQETESRENAIRQQQAEAQRRARQDAEAQRRAEQAAAARDQAMRQKEIEEQRRAQQEADARERAARRQEAQREFQNRELQARSQRDQEMREANARFQLVQNHAVRVYQQEQAAANAKFQVTRSAAAHNTALHLILQQAHQQAISEAQGNYQQSMDRARSELEQTQSMANERYETAVREVRLRLQELSR